jgi:UDP-glucose 4-epimerase
VTGGAGFIGSHLVDALVARGDHVVVIDNLSVGCRENLVPHIATGRAELHVADVLDGDRLPRLFDGVDTIFHLATQCVRVSLFDPELVHKVNTEGTLRVLTAGVTARIRRFVYVSSSESFGSAKVVPMAEDHPRDPTTIYGASKLAGEHYTMAFHRTYGLDTIIARPFNTYGPRAHFEGAYGELIPKSVVRVLSGRAPIIFGDGEQTRDFTYVEDTVRGILLAGDSNLVGQSINIARGEEVTVNRVVQLILEECGRADLRAEHGPDRPADVRRHYGDISRARRELGFAPLVEITEGIRRYVKWFRETYADIGAVAVQEQPINWQAIPK